MGYKSLMRRFEKEIILNKSLSHPARNLLIYLSTKPQGWKYNSVNVAKDFGVSRVSARNWLNELLRAHAVSFLGEVKEKAKNLA